MEKYNLHTHTYRCKHAIGDVPELAEVARESGYTTLGFSEHTSLCDDTWPDMRLDRDKTDEYFGEIEKCRIGENSKPDGLRIFSGLECEPPPKYWNYYRELVEKYKIDYLLEAGHFFMYKGELLNAFDERYDNQNKIKTYIEYLIKGMESGLFLYLAHPDVFMTTKDKWDAYTNDTARELIRASIKYKVPLEINLNGYRKGLVRRGLNLRYQYPYEKFWELAAKENAEVVEGVDAHSPRNFIFNYPDYETLLERYSLNILNEEEILKRLKRSTKHNESI